MNAEVTHDFFDAIVREVTVTAVQLQTLVCHAAACLCDELLGHRAELRRIRRACVELPCRLTQECAGCLEFDFHLGQAELQRLELVDGFAECLAFGHVDQRRIECRLRRAQRTGRNVQATTVESCHRIAEPFAFFAQEVVGRDFDIVHLNLTGRLRFPAHLLFKAAE